MKTTANLEVVKSHKGYTYYIASAKFREGKYKIYVKDKYGNTANHSCFVYPKDVAIEICRNSKCGEIQEIK